jgi:hypothetical protein
MNHIWQSVIKGSYCEVLVAWNPAAMFCMGVHVSTFAMVNTTLRIQREDPVTSKYTTELPDHLLWADMCKTDLVLP